MSTSGAAERGQELGDRLRRLRVEAGLSQESLAHRAGLSVRTIRKLEAGGPDAVLPATRRMIAAALGVDRAGEAWLFEEASPPAAIVDRAFVAPLVGRDAELDRLDALLAQDDVRLVTLTGPGGVGTTRLALEAADRHATAELLAAVAAETLPVRAGGDPRAALEFGLRDRRLLLVLDNLEHLLAAAPEIGWLLRALPGVTAIATSREALRLAGERVIDLQPLDASDLDGDAVRLFLQLAERVAPDAEPDAADLDAVRELCRRVGGLPLAIELAAAQMARLSPRHLLSLLDAVGFRALASGPRDVPARQASMDALIGWSWDLLDEDLRDAMKAACAFAGGFDLTALAAVLGAVRGIDQAEATALAADALFALTRSSLLMRQPPHESDREPRYLALEPIRQYGVGRLAASGREDAFRRAHAEWALARAAALDAEAEESRGEGRMRDLEASIDRLEREYPNVCAALDWAEAAGESGIAGRLAGELKWLWMYSRRPQPEGRQAGRLAAASQLEPGALFISHYSLAEEAARAADADALRAACARMTEAADEWDDPLLRAMALLFLTDLEEDPAAALAMVDEAAGLIGPDRDWEELPFLQAWTRIRRGIELHRLGRLDEALAALEEGVARKRIEGNLSGLPAPLAHLGLLQADLGRPRLAAETLLEAVALASDAWAAVHAARWLADLAERQGGPEAAALAARLAAALEAADAAGDERPAPDQPSSWFTPAMAEALEAAAALPARLPERAPRHVGPREMAVRLE